MISVYDAFLPQKMSNSNEREFNLLADMNMFLCFPDENINLCICNHEYI